MKTLFRQILETALFNADFEHGIVLLPQTEEIAVGEELVRQSTGSFSIPEDLFPSNCRVCRLPSGEAFLSSLQEAIPTGQVVRIFLLPPLLGRKDLSDTLRAQFPGMDFGEIVLSRVAEMVAPSSIVGVLLPASFFLNESSRATRESLRETAVPRLVIAHDHPVDVFGLPLHSQFRMGTYLLEKGGDRNAPVRFFKCLSVANDAERLEVLNDFRRLLEQPGGKTRYGYVIRESLSPGASLNYDAYHPDLAKRQQDLAHFGGIRRLGELFEIKRGLQMAMDRHLLVDAAEGRGVVLVEGRDIKMDGTLACEEPRYRAVVPEERQLRPGDVCIRAILGSQNRLVCATFTEEMEPATASQTVIVLRPRAELTAHEQGFLLAYLRSSACWEFLRARGIGVQVLPSRLLDLPVPVGDEALNLAVENLGNAAHQFRAWAEELDAARGSLFDSQSARNARITALSMGRLAKQRYEAALLVSDFRQRVRTRFPYPVAFRWRTVESQHPNGDGYREVLECAEVATTYLAIVALLLARTVQKPIRWLGEMANRISTTGHGSNMGDWVSILQEAGGASFAGDIPETSPFIEVSRFQNDPKAKRCLELLHKWRNDFSHGRGPKGAEMLAAFENAKKELGALLQVTEFLTDYPLRYIEATRRDTLRKVTRYDYRELMGDHALVPVSHAETSDTEIEAGSLYLLDRAGKLHLLRPLLTGRECPVCHSWGTFFLDTQLKAGKGVVLKSMEHGHTIEDMEALDPLRASGMLA